MIDLALVVRFGLLLVRPGMLVIVAPILGGTYTPTPVKVAITVLLALVLVMLVTYAICGAGEFSLDHYLRRVPPEVATAEPALSMQRSLQEPHASVPRATPSSIEDLKRDDLRVELRGSNLDLPVEPPQARERYRSVKQELLLLLGAIGVLLGLLGLGLYVAAAAWLIGSLVMLTIWLIGQAQLD